MADSDSWAISSELFLYTMPCLSIVPSEISGAFFEQLFARNHDVAALPGQLFPGQLDDTLHIERSLSEGRVPTVEHCLHACM